MKVEMRGIDKSFSANRVLTDVSFSVAGGEICALLGENGAGKSTLMNILGGVLKQDAGEILLDGKKVSFSTPAESLDAGIAFIHQELNLVNDLAVYENMYIGRELFKKCGPFSVLDRDAMCQNCRTVFESIGIELDPRAMVRDLDASYKQIVEIARALIMNASIIIMDEPTTSLTPTEIERVFEMMRNVRDKGVGIVFISHKLPEVLEVCDRYVVLRDGVTVAEGDVSAVTTNELAAYMVGHEVRSSAPDMQRSFGEVRLRVKQLTLEPYFRNISFSVRAGEVLGFTGLLGDGRSEIFRTVFGVMGAYEGEILVNEIPVKISSAKQAVALGIGYVPRNRKENGIVKDMSIIENASLATMERLTKNGFISEREERARFDEQAQLLHIKLESPYDLIGSLSGGNQQKVVLSKWLLAEPGILIFDNPTQGVDVGAKEEIYDIIHALAKEGVAVVVLSSEVQEIMRLCDRAYVMYHGEVRGELTNKEMTERGIMLLATGGN